MPTVTITDHGFPAVELQRKVIETAGFTLEEIKPNCKTEQEVIQKCSEAEVLLVQWAPITRRVLEALPRVRGIVRYGVGVDNIDVQGARELGRVVSNVPHYCQDEVSDHAIAMILSLARRIPHDHNQLREGKWGITPFLPIPAFSDLTLGFVAFGSIARKVSEKAKPFRFRQIAFDPVSSADTFAKYGVEPGVLGYQKDSEDVKFGRHTSACYFAPVDHAQIARACGCRGITVERPADYLCAVREGLATSEATVIDVMTDPEAYPPVAAFDDRLEAVRRSTGR